MRPDVQTILRSLGFRPLGGGPEIKYRSYFFTWGQILEVVLSVPYVRDHYARLN